MKSIARLGCLVVTLFSGPLLGGSLSAQEHIAWAPDFQTATSMAGEQRRLVLLHFYNDNCEPCLRLEQNVFNRPEVAQAVHQNFVAVKVHAGLNPQLAARYRVNRWPTDVFVTAAGQEVFRTISPQKPGEYVAVLNQVAHQTGIAATRSWGQVAQAVVPASAQAALDAQRLAGTFDAAAQQATTAAQSNLQSAQNRLSAASNQFQQATGQAQQAADHAAATAQQGIQTANQWGQQAVTTAQQYQQQAAEARQQLERQAMEARQQMQQQAGQFGQQVQQQAQAAQQQLADTAHQTAGQFQQTATAALQPWQQVATSMYDRRSAFVPMQSGAESSAGTAPVAGAMSPAATAPAQTTVQANMPAPTIPAATAPAVTNTSPALTASAPTMPAPTMPAPTMIAPPPASTASKNGVPLPQQNPWMTNSPKETKPAATASNPPPTTPVASMPVGPQVGSWQSGAAAGVQSPVPQQAAMAGPGQTAAVAPQGPPPASVPASQAPPIALDGFCPVTLLDSVARNPGDRSAWRKGDKQFGAIHRGRTYLFTSPENQQKFLANPDAYAPALSGCDPVRFAERGEFVDGKRAYGLITPERQIFLFADEATRNRFEQSPGTFSTAIRQAMQRADAGNVYR